MKTTQKFMFGLITLCLSASALFAQEKDIVRNNLNSIEIEQIIKKVTKNEDDFRIALTNYVFNRKAKIQTVGLGGLITGTYQRDSFMTFRSDGKRFEKVTYAPISTLKELQITPEDIEDLSGVNPFAINPQDIANYTFSYIGKQLIDEINTHVFDVRPKVIPNYKKSKKRYFTGRIWVDDRDLLIVKSKGKGIPEGKQRFPVVETWRTNVDGKYWFPAYTSSDDELEFSSGQVVKLRMRVRYENYKRGRSEVIIEDGDDVIIEDDEPKEETKDKPKKDEPKKVDN